MHKDKPAFLNVYLSVPGLVATRLPRAAGYNYLHVTKRTPFPSSLILTQAKRKRSVSCKAPSYSTILFRRGGDVHNSHSSCCYSHFHLFLAQAKTPAVDSA
jgi:hypothetical protein